MIVQTVVFEFETQEQRQATLGKINDMLFAETAPRVTGLSVDDELRRAQMMFDALERYDDHFDLREAITALYETPSLRDFSWEKFEAETS
jgi:hypothetical protein